MASIIIEISPGELIERLTILEIKPERLRDPVKPANVQAEHAALQTNVETQVDRSDALHVLHAELGEVNLRLWDIEDEIRDCECRKDLGASFVALARSVYLTNDRRREVKRDQCSPRSGARRRKGLSADGRGPAIGLSKETGRMAASRRNWRDAAVPRHWEDLARSAQSPIRKAAQCPYSAFQIPGASCRDRAGETGERWDTTDCPRAAFPNASRTRTPAESRLACPLPPRDVQPRCRRLR